MSYENTVCPCGDKKPTDTMLCDECYKAFRDRREMDDYQDPTLPVEYRRHAAVVLVSLARGRKRCAECSRDTNRKEARMRETHISPVSMVECNAEATRNS